VERRLKAQGHGPIDVTRILRGELDLKLWQLLAILDVLELHPLEFFRMVFGEPGEPSPFRRQLDALMGAHQQQ
jgi:hypothetical protein